MKSTRATAIGCVVTSLLLGLMAAPVEAASRPAGGRGSLVSITPIADLDTAQIAATLADVPFEGAQTHYVVKLYRIEYATIDVRNHPTTASALVALPVHGPATARTVVWEHGTRTGRADVASVSGDNVDRPAAELFATDGYVTIAPDYLGLGTGPGPHPYTNARTEASASLDAVRAGRALAAGRGERLSNDVLVSGFSQGGQAAMALGQAIQGSNSGLRLRALAPISGPYDLAGTEIPALFDGRVEPYVGAFYLAYWTISSNRIYGLYRSPSDVFQAPFDQTLPALFDGSHDEEDIFPALPASVDDLITPQYAAQLHHPEGTLRRAIQENDQTCQWRPRVPVRLYTATGDRQVPRGNTDRCAAELQAHGVTPTVIDLGQLDHLDEPAAAVTGIASWFDQLAAPPTHP